MLRAKSYIGVVILSLAVLLVAGCAGHPEGMKSPRELTDREKDRVIEIALNTPEALRQLETENKYETGVDWIAIVWNNSQCSAWWHIDCEWETDPNLKNVPKSAVFYPQVLIRFGEPEQWHVMVAVDLQTEKAVYVQQNPARKGPTPPAPGGIEGTVTDSDGKPVIGMGVWIVSGTAGFPEIAAQTNGEGYYQIGSVPPGTFEVAVHDREGNRIGLESVVVRSGSIATLNFVISTEEKPEGTLTVAELLENPVYDIEVAVFGTVGLLGELFCPCFELTSGGQKVQVWYDLMVDNDGRERPAVSVEGIKNGDRVVVTGELKGEGGTHYSKGDFWATAIVVTPLPVPPTEVRVSVQASCDEFYQQTAISKEVEVAVGDSFRVILCSNPTTGFQWSEAQVSDQTVLQQTDHRFVPPEETGIVGAAGQDVWTFEALKEGKSTVSMEYSRPWEGGVKAEWTFVLTVVVK